MSEHQEFLTPRQLSKKLNVSLKWVTNHTQAGRIPGQTKIGRVWRYKASEVEKKLLTGSLLLEESQRVRR